MTNPVLDRIAATPYPRLTMVVLGGVASFAAAGILAAADPMLSATYGGLAFRLSVVGYLLVLFGGAGYVALLVADRVPEA